MQKVARLKRVEWSEKGFIEKMIFKLGAYGWKGAERMWQEENPGIKQQKILRLESENVLGD